MAVSVEKDGPVWTVINDRPEARNAADPETAEALYRAFLDFDADEDAQVAVFWGKGGHFCAGWDLKFAASLNGSEAGESEFARLALSDARGLHDVRAAMGPSRLQMSKPVIAAVEGAAVAGGMELALWADVRVMAETAYMGVYCRRWGVSLVDGGTVRLPRLVGQGRALEIAMTGRKVEADECLSIGLCEKVVPEGEARAAAEAMAHEIARFPLEAMLADRRSILDGQGLSEEEALRREWARGIGAIANQGTAGAGRFAAGAGRSGDFHDI